MVDQAHQQLTGQGAEKVHLKHFEAQYRIKPDHVQQLEHHVVDTLGYHRAAVQPHRGALVTVEHDVIEVIALMPGAELGAQAVMLGFRGEYLDRGQIEFGKLRFDTGFLGCQQGIVLFRLHAGKGHRLTSVFCCSGRAADFSTAAVSLHSRINQA